jgi:hypothetical protein
MYVNVKFFKHDINAYGGRDYLYSTRLAVNVGDKVYVPTVDGYKRAIVVAVNVPKTEINPAWADRIKEITRFDDGMEEVKQ